MEAHADPGSGSALQRIKIHITYTDNSCWLCGPKKFEICKRICSQKPKQIMKTLWAKILELKIMWSCSLKKHKKCIRLFISFFFFGPIVAYSFQYIMNIISKCTVFSYSHYLLHHCLHPKDFFSPNFLQIIRKMFAKLIYWNTAKLCKSAMFSQKG